MIIIFVYNLRHCGIVNGLNLIKCLMCLHRGGSGSLFVYIFTTAFVKKNRSTFRDWINDDDLWCDWIAQIIKMKSNLPVSRVNTKKIMNLTTKIWKENPWFFKCLNTITGCSAI